LQLEILIPNSGIKTPNRISILANKIKKGIQVPSFNSAFTEILLSPAGFAKIYIYSPVAARLSICLFFVSDEPIENTLRKSKYNNQIENTFSSTNLRPVYI
jgi:hypothetical protein